MQTSCTAQLRAAIAPATARPVTVFRHDESRCGVLTVRRRRRTARGVQPVGTIQHRDHWLDVYGAVAPTTGESVFVEMAHLTRAPFQGFVDELAKAFPDSLNLLVLDRSGAHFAQAVELPPNVRLVPLPPASPELNPIERVWRDLKDHLAWRQFTNLDALETYVAEVLCAYDAATLRSLTSYQYLVDAIHALSA